MNSSNKKNNLNIHSTNCVKMYQKALKNMKTNPSSTTNLKEKVINWLFSTNEVSFIQKVLSIENPITVSVINGMFTEFMSDKRNLFALKNSQSFPAFLIFPTNIYGNIETEYSLYNFVDFSSKNLVEPKKNDSAFLKQLHFYNSSPNTYFDNLTLSPNLLKDKASFTAFFDLYSKDYFTTLPSVEQDKNTKGSYIRLSDKFELDCYYSLVDLIIFMLEQLIMVRYLIFQDTNNVVSFKYPLKDFHQVFEDYSTFTKFLVDSVNKKGEKVIECIDFKAVLEAVIKSSDIIDLIKRKTKRDHGHFKSYYANSKQCLKKNPIFDCSDICKFKFSVIGKLRHGAQSFMESIMFISLRRIWSYDSFVSIKLYEEINKLFKEKLIQDLLEEGNLTSNESTKKKKKGAKDKKTKEKSEIIYESIKSPDKSGTIEKPNEVVEKKEEGCRENDLANSFANPIVTDDYFLMDQKCSNSFSQELSQDTTFNQEHHPKLADSSKRNDSNLIELVEKSHSVPNRDHFVLVSDDILLNRENMINVSQTFQEQYSQKDNQQVEEDNTSNLQKDSENESNSININPKKKPKKEKNQSFFLYDTTKLTVKKTKNTKSTNIANNSKSLIKTFQKFDEREYPFLFSQRLHNDIIDFALNVSNNLSFVKAIKLELINVLKKEFTENFQTISNFLVYGSFATELSIESSDIDLRVVFKDQTNMTEEIKRFVEYCEFRSDLFMSIKPIFTASIPVVKLVSDIYSFSSINNKFITEKLEKLSTLKSEHLTDLLKIKLDITFSSESSDETKEVIDSVNYIQKYLVKFPEVLPIIYILKHALQRVQLNSVYNGGIPSFSLFLIVLAFTLFQRNIVKKSTTYNLGIFLNEMLDFYGNSFSFLKYFVEINLNGK